MDNKRLLELAGVQAENNSQHLNEADQSVEKILQGPKGQEIVNQHLGNLVNDIARQAGIEPSEELVKQLFGGDSALTEMLTDAVGQSGAYVRDIARQALATRNYKG